MSNETSEVELLIPQKPPFVMIGALHEVTENGIRSRFIIKAENPLVIEGVFQESGLVENMAQTAALYAGYNARENDEPTPIGYIGGLKNLQIFNLPRINEELVTSIILKNNVVNIQIVEALVRNVRNEILAKCELRIFLKEDGNA